MTPRARASTLVLSGAIAPIAAWMSWVSHTADKYVGMIASDFEGDKD